MCCCFICQIMNHMCITVRSSFPASFSLVLWFTRLWTPSSSRHSVRLQYSCGDCTVQASHPNLISLWLMQDSHKIIFPLVSVQYFSLWSSANSALTDIVLKNELDGGRNLTWIRKKKFCNFRIYQWHCFSMDMCATMLFWVESLDRGYVIILLWGTSSPNISSWGNLWPRYIVLFLFWDISFYCLLGFP